MTPPALFFHPDQVEGAGRDLVGRRSAGSSFLRGWLAHAGGEEVRAVTDTPAHAKALSDLLREMGEPRPLRATALAGSGDFTDAGAVIFPTPGYQTAAWRRQRLGPERCSLVGLTHTVSTRRIVEGLLHLAVEPVEDWDAIVCTSRAVRSVVARLFEAQADYLRARFRARRVPQPRLPVIPLGINAADFAPRPGARASFRQTRGVPEGDLVVLTMGRLSVVEKANPLPLVLALEALARDLPKPLHLWMAGWASRPEEEALHRDAARLCPSVAVTILDGRAADVRRDAWAAADVFTLPSDSIQETFGLVPVEAMAAGLPVVMPDWDGFRDTVVHGETGLLVPTRMAPPGLGAALGRRFAEGTDGYLQHLALVQAHVQLDVPAYAQALRALLLDPALRARMGAAGRAHVARSLDWRAVVPRYLALAEELAEARRGAEATTPLLPGRAPSALESDPFDLYAAYPSAPLSGAAPLALGPRADAAFLRRADRLSGRELYGRRLLALDGAEALLDLVRAAPGLTVAEAASRLGLDGPTVAGLVLALAKADALRLPPPPLRPPS